MANILDLPNEILLQIIEEFKEAVPTDIESLTACCKRIRALGDKLLEIHRTHRRLYGSVGSSDQGDLDKADRLLLLYLQLRDLLAIERLCLYLEAWK